MQRYTIYYIWELLYMFRVVPPPIIRRANNCIYRIWYLSHRYYYLPLKMQRYTVYYIWKLLYMFRVVFPPIIRSAYNCIYSIWYLSQSYCYLTLSSKSWKSPITV